MIEKVKDAFTRGPNAHDVTSLTLIACICYRWMTVYNYEKLCSRVEDDRVDANEDMSDES